MEQINSNIEIVNQLTQLMTKQAEKEAVLTVHLYREVKVHFSEHYIRNFRARIRSAHKVFMNAIFNAWYEDGSIDESIHDALQKFYIETHRNLEDLYSKMDSGAFSKQFRAKYKLDYA